ncbi:formylglycine-generating enzyme family protein [Streptomyces sp. A7024]|uniref:Formylglycine-generating enzyme family protein n=2 Tax=Streptomyces coryli TaxID=1128680 RepID=A0A6G4UE00_9ACTN|nr:formylglycine-generating enzyme family protein [Streptomyces coryli]NGN69906.1 formylglycine-generating enzyme family protein [Streptomyces coryli]
MTALPGGRFRMGSDRHYPEEAPAHEVSVGPFAIAQHPVTNAQFAAFVGATDYVTVAERPLRAADYPGVPAARLAPGSMVFRPTRGPVDLRDLSQWWEWMPGASWRKPEGPGSGLRGRKQHPVVHIAHEDAEAYARWRGLRLPTEAEWEYAARGGLDGADYTWGDEAQPGGRRLAHWWLGDFPWRSTRPGGVHGPAPVGSYPPNGYGLFDTAGNVWEWTADWFAPTPGGDAAPSCCGPAEPRGGTEQGSVDPAQPGRPIPRKVVKGGSWLCADEYCRRYRPAARRPQPVDTGMSHIGFRCAADVGGTGSPG